MTLIRRIVLGLALASPAAALAQDSQPTGAFIVRLGTDTTAVERFTRTGTTYQIEQAIRSPRTSFRHTHLELTPSGEIATFHSDASPDRQSGGAAAWQHEAVVHEW